MISPVPEDNRSSLSDVMQQYGISGKYTSALSRYQKKTHILVDNGSRMAREEAERSLYSRACENAKTIALFASATGSETTVHKLCSQEPPLRVAPTGKAMADLDRFLGRSPSQREETPLLSKTLSVLGNTPNEQELHIVHITGNLPGEVITNYDPNDSGSEDGGGQEPIGVASFLGIDEYKDMLQRQIASRPLLVTHKVVTLQDPICQGYEKLKGERGITVIYPRVKEMVDPEYDSEVYLLRGVLGKKPEQERRRTISPLQNACCRIF